MCMHLCESMCTAHTQEPGKPEVGTGTLETGWSYRWWCFEPNPGLLQECAVLVTAGPSPWLHPLVLL